MKKQSTMFLKVSVEARHIEDIQKIAKQIIETITRVEKEYPGMVVHAEVDVDVGIEVNCLDEYTL